MNPQCHAPTLSQARDNRRINPSRIINIFLELAQGFHTPVHTYNSPITGEYITKFEENAKGCVYISEVQARTNIQPNGSILYKRKFNTKCYYKGIYVYNMFEKKGTHQASKKIQQLPSTRGIGNTHYST